MSHGVTDRLLDEALAKAGLLPSLGKVVPGGIAETALPPDQATFTPPATYNDPVELEDGVTDRFRLGPNSVLLGTALGDKFGLKPENPERVIEELQRPSVVDGQDILERIVRNDKAERVRVDFKDAGIQLKETPPEPEPLEFPSGLPLYELAPDVCCTMSMEDRIKTLQAMTRHDLLHLPFPKMAIRVWLRDIAADVHGPEVLKEKVAPWVLTFQISEPFSIDADGAVEFGSGDDLAEIELPNCWKRVIDLKDPAAIWDGYVADGFTRRDLVKCLEHNIGVAAMTLVTALANRHTVEASPTERNTRFNNKHKQPKPQFRSATGAIYISLTRVQRPPIEDMIQQPGTHASPTPHERCGHNHTVLFGVGRRERRVQWFPPVWVNGPKPDEYVPRKRVVKA
jgi:hypothetical protein